MAYQFQSLRLGEESELTATGQGETAWIPVEMRFLDEETGIHVMVHASVVVDRSSGRDMDILHEEAAAKAEDLLRAATQHLEENDVETLRWQAQGI